jgi:hypothetical protein
MRDLRLEFTRQEFSEFLFHIKEMNNLFHEWLKQNPNWEASDDPEGFKNKFVVWLGDYKPGSHKLQHSETHYWPRRLSVERNASGTYHFHYRNYRIELTRAAFQQLHQAFSGVGERETDVLEQRRSEFLKKDREAGRVSPEFRGFLDEIQGTRVLGWVQAVADAKIPWEVSIVSAGRELGRTLASQFRGDLEQAFGYGHSAFEMELPEIARLSPGEIQAFVLPSRIELGKGEPTNSGNIGQQKPAFILLTEPSALPMDPVFFDKFIKGKPLKSIACQDVGLHSLRVHMYTPKGDQFIPVGESPAYRYLCGDKKIYEDYHRHENAYNRHSENEFLELIDSMKKTGYDANRLITVFNGDGIIRDGHHRAAILLQQNCRKIQILNIHFGE